MRTVGVSTGPLYEYADPELISQLERVVARAYEDMAGCEPKMIYCLERDIMLWFKIKWRFAWTVRHWRGPVGRWGNRFVWHNSEWDE